MVLQKQNAVVTNVMGAIIQCSHYTTRNNPAPQYNTVALFLMTRAHVSFRLTAAPTATSSKTWIITPPPPSRGRGHWSTRPQSKAHIPTHSLKIMAIHLPWKNTPCVHTKPTSQHKNKRINNLSYFLVMLSPAGRWCRKTVRRIAARHRAEKIP